MWSTDCPHVASNWPNSRQVSDRQFGCLPKAGVKKSLHDNCKRLYCLDRIPERL